MVNENLLLGAFYAGGVSDLVFIEWKMDAQLYTEVLKEGLLPMFTKHGLDREYYIFQEDGDPKHQSKLAKKWKKNQQINFLENWPPYSPDLNPIENLWSIIKRRVGCRKPAGVEEAKQFLLEEWRRLEADGKLVQLIHSMPKRCSEVIKTKGYPTKY